MILTLTGIPLFYPEAPWAKPLMTLLGGPHMAGIIHRVNAVIFAGVFFWHLFYIGIRIGRDWKNFKIFGPNSLIPGLQDLKDILAMFKRSEEHTSELQSLMRTSYAVFCLKKKKTTTNN